MRAVGLACLLLLTSMSVGGPYEGVGVSVVAGAEIVPPSHQMPGMDDLKATYAYVLRSPTARAIISDVSSTHSILLRLPSRPGADYFVPTGDGRGLIVWDPRAAAWDTSTGAHVSPSVAFIHELIHAQHWLHAPNGFRTAIRTTDPTYDDLEERQTMAVERRVAADLGEDARESHHGIIYAVASPTTR
jgi:hypothetical protein